MFHSDSPRCGPDPQGAAARARPRCRTRRTCPSWALWGVTRDAPPRAARDQRHRRARRDRAGRVQRAAAALVGHHLPRRLHRGRGPAGGRHGDDRGRRGGPRRVGQARRRPRAGRVRRRRTPGSATRPARRSRSARCWAPSTSRSTRRAAAPLDPATPIPLARTASPLDVVAAFDGLSGTLDQLDTNQLATSLETLADDVPRHPRRRPRRARRAVPALHDDREPRRPDPQAARGHPPAVRGARRSAPTTSPRCSSDGNRLLGELQQRQDAIARLLDGTRRLSQQLSRPRRGQPGPAAPDAGDARPGRRRAAAQPGRPRRDDQERGRRSSACSPTPSATGTGSTATSAGSCPRPPSARSTRGDADDDLGPAPVPDLRLACVLAVAPRRGRCGSSTHPRGRPARHRLLRRRVRAVPGQPGDGARRARRHDRHDHARRARRCAST